MNLNQAQQISEFPPNPFFEAPILSAEQKVFWMKMILMRIILGAPFEAQQRAQTDQQATTDYDEQNQKATHLNTNTFYNALIYDRYSTDVQ